MSDISELIEKMGSKKKIEDIDIESETPEQKEARKYKSKIEKEGMDYYAILGVAKDASDRKIKMAYHKALAKYHPDKVPKEQQDKEYKTKWKLIREAGDILTNKYKKKAYDAERTLAKNSRSFESQKGSFKEFLKLQESQATDENKKIAKLNFDRELAELNNQHGYDPDADKNPISKEDFSRMAEDLETQRKQEELEVDVENMFEGRSFSNAEFNKVFEKKKKRDEKRKKVGGLVKVGGGVSAFNDGIDGSGTGIDSYDNLYSQGAYSGFDDNYAGIGSGLVGNDDGMSEDDVSIDSVDGDDYDSHNKGVAKEDLDARMKAMMADRNTQDSAFEKMKPGEYGSAIDDEYGVSNQLGFMVGDSKFFGHQRSSKKSDNKLKEKTLKIYKQLTEK